MATIAVQGTPDDMLEAARYFQTLPMQQDRAILLYHKVKFAYVTIILYTAF